MPEQPWLRGFFAAVAVAVSIAGCAYGTEADNRVRPGHTVTGAPAPAASSTSKTAGEPVPTELLPQPPALVGRSGTPRVSVPALLDIDEEDAAAVGRAAVTTMWSVDTLFDATQWDAAMRAAPYLTPQYLEALRLSPQVAAPGAHWDTWAAHQAVTTVSVRSADEMGKPANTATEAFHAFVLDVTPRGRDAWEGPSVSAVVFVTLTRPAVSEPWRVESVRTV